MAAASARAAPARTAARRAHVERSRPARRSSPLASFSGRGALWETLVLGELVEWREAHHPEAKLWCYRDREGVEVDFVVEQGGRRLALDASAQDLSP